MSIRYLKAGLLVVLALVLVSPAYAEPAPLVRISSENGPSHVQTRLLQRFVDNVRARAGDRLVIDFQHSGNLFRDRDIVSALQQGKVEMALPGTWQLDRFDPNIGALLLPMFYGRDATTTDRLLDGDMGREVNRRLEEVLGLHVLGRWMHLGFAHLYTLDRPVRRQDEIAGLRIRTPGGEVNNRRLAAMGAEVITVPWPDLPQALRIRRVDGLLSTHATVASERLWAHGVRYCFEDRQYFPQYVPLFSDLFWSRLSPDLRDILTSTWEELVDEGRREAAVAQEAARRELLEHGVKIIQPDAKDLRVWRNRLVESQMQWAVDMGIDIELVSILRRNLGD